MLVRNHLQAVVVSAVVFSYAADLCTIVILPGLSCGC